MTISTVTKWAGSPCVSVVIPARDASLTIGRMLQTLSTERDAVQEVIVVDDGSSDGTADVAVDAARLHLLPLTVVRRDVHNAGAARNVGLDRAAGEFVYLLDADDEVVEGGLRALVERLDAEKSASLAVGGYVRRGEGLRDKIRLPTGFTEDRIFNARRYLSNDIRSIAMGSALLRRTAIRGTRFPEKLSFDEDTIFWAAVLTMVDVAVISRAVLIYNTNNGRYVDRLTTAPRRDFVRIVGALKSLRRFGVDDGTLEWREAWIARRLARALMQQGTIPAAQRFLKVAMAHGEFRRAPTTIRYALRILLSRARRAFVARLP